jgi:pyridoxamine 5'-phosphate oxidase family protein
MSAHSTTFTDAELEYLSSQRLGRLATVGAGGAPQNNPVGFHLNAELGTLDIYGLNMGATRKFRNVRTNPNVALVIDDLASIDPWTVRGIEIRGVAEAVDDVPPAKGMSRQVIRIHPRRVISWGINPGHAGMRGRDFADPSRAV